MLGLRPCLESRVSFNFIYRPLLLPSRLTRVLQGFSLIKSKQLSSRVHGKDACGKRVQFLLGRRLNTLKIIVIVLFQIRPGRKHCVS